MKKILLFVCLIFCLLGGVFCISVSLPCSNGQKIILFNATGQDIVVRFYDSKWQNVLMEEVIPRDNMLEKGRFFIPSSEYNIDVYSSNSVELYRGGSFGYISASPESSFFWIGQEGVEYLAMPDMGYIKPLFKMAINELSCIGEI